MAVNNETDALVDRYRPKQLRARVTVDALIDAAIAEIEAVGPVGLRQERVALLAGVSQGSIYHHFGSRDGLIDAAYVEMFSRHIDEFVAEAHALLSSDLHDEVYERLLDMVLAPERRGIRSDRLGAMAATLQRPSLAPAIAAEQRRLTVEFARILDELKRRQVIAPYLDSEAVAVLLQAVSLGRICATLDSSPVPAEELRIALWAGFRGLGLPIEDLPAEKIAAKIREHSVPAS